MSSHGKSERLTVRDLRRMKGKKKITALTSYDYPMGSVVDEAGVDVVLVGDSLGNVVLGHEDTLGVTMEDIIRHSQAVARALKKAFLVGDLPFMSYQISALQAVENAGKLIAQGKAQGVKLEGGRTFAVQVQRIVQAGIPVMGHIGLTPQSVNQMGGYYMHGKSDEDRARLLDDAMALQDAGCFSLVLECVEASLAEEITRKVQIPTIGIGSGKGTDGQILVVNDLIGLNPGPVPRFVTPRANVREVIKKAVAEWIDDVRDEGKVEDSEESEAGGG